MPKLWERSIDAHRVAVRASILSATATLVADSGLGSVTMSRIAQEAGIGRATLYKYFPDLDAVLLAWHDQHVAAHLARLRELVDSPGEPLDRLRAACVAVTRMYADIPEDEIARRLHHGGHVLQATQHLAEILGALLQEGVERGEVRGDVPVGELVRYCLAALTAASEASSAAVRRLITVTLDGLRAPSPHRPA